MEGARPFPRGRCNFALAEAVGSAWLRPFGTSGGDLNIDFRQTRPQLTTEILSHCSADNLNQPLAQTLLWQLPIGTRIEALLVLADMARAQPLSWHVRCRHSGCEVLSELELEINELLQIASSVPQTEQIATEIEGRAVVLRLPTGEDQLRWISEGCNAASIATSLVVNPPVQSLLHSGLAPEQIAEGIDAAMDFRDPLVGFSLSVVCSQCGEPSEQTLDLSEAAVSRLWSVQAGLIEDVDRLARIYHWSEAEIVALPAWRREEYLQCIDAGGVA